MIQHEGQYLEYIQRQGVGANDKVASSPKSYVSYLNGVSLLIGADVSPALLHSEEDVERVANKLQGQREPGTIRNYTSAMRQYVAMVSELRLWHEPIHESKPMTAENFDHVLQALRQRKPFQVFTVELAGGHRFEVDHPGAIVIRDGVAVFIAPGGIPVWFDHESVSQIEGARANPSGEPG